MNSTATPHTYFFLVAIFGRYQTHTAETFMTGPMGNKKTIPVCVQNVRAEGTSSYFLTAPYRHEGKYYEF